MKDVQTKSKILRPPLPYLSRFVKNLLHFSPASHSIIPAIDLHVILQHRRIKNYTLKPHRKDIRHILYMHNNAFTLQGRRNEFQCVWTKARVFKIVQLFLKL